METLPRVLVLTPVKDASLHLQRYFDLLLQLPKANKEIVVPHCRLSNGNTFDLNTFAFYPDKAAAERKEFIRDGLFQPGKGQGRRYLDSFRDHSIIEVDGVGGTTMLAKDNGNTC